MPILHIVFSALAVIVLAGVIRDTVRLSRGRLKVSPAVSVALTIAGGLAAWQAATWLGSDHPDATALFRAGVILQFGCALGIAGLSLVGWRLSRRQVG